MQYIKLCDQSCRSKGFYFTAKEEDFAYLQDQFEAKMFNMKLLRIMKGQFDESDFEKNMKPNASEEARLRNKQQVWEKLKMRVCYEIIQSLDKRSAMFFRPYKKWSQGLGRNVW